MHRLALALAATAAACVDAPDVLRVDVGVTAGVAAYDVRIERGRSSRCERFTVPEIAIPADRVAAGDRIVVTGLDERRAPTGVGAVVVDRDDPAVALTPIERAVPRGVSEAAHLTGSGTPGRQLAITPAGAVVAAWIDRTDDLAVLGRRLDGSRESFDHGLVPYIDAGRDSPAIAALGEDLVAAWTLGQQAVRAHVVDAALEPINGFGDMPIAESDSEEERLGSPQLVTAGDRTLVLWSSRRDQVYGRIGLRWLRLEDRAIALGPIAFLGEPDAEQLYATGAALPSGDVVIGWIEQEASATSTLRLVRVPRDGAPDLATAVRLDVAGSGVGSLALARVGDQIAVAWSVDAYDQARARVVRVDAALAVVGEPVDLAIGTRQVALAAVGDGLLVSWVEQLPSVPQTVWLQWLAADTTPRGPARRAGLVAGGEQLLPSVAGNPSGVAAIVWQQGAAPGRDAGIVGRLVAPDDSDAAPSPCNLASPR